MLRGREEADDDDEKRRQICLQLVLTLLDARDRDELCECCDGG
jgi:hypothetical protein